MRLVLISILMVICTATGVAKDKDKIAMNSIADSWNGLYLGGNFGRLIAKALKNDATPLEIFDDNNGGDTFKGLTFGSFEGLAQTSGNFLYGIEVGFEAADAVDNRPIGANETRFKSNIGYLGSARLRLGYTYDNLLIYSTGGLAFAQVNSEYWSTKLQFQSSLQPGWTIGAGIEFKANEHWSTRVEYSLTNLAMGNLCQTIDPLLACSKSITDHSLKVGISYQF